MSRWLNLLGFFAVVSILTALVMSAFVHDVLNVPRTGRYGTKDCFGHIPEELKVLREYSDPASLISAKQSPSTSSFAPLALGKKGSIIFPMEGGGRADALTKSGKAKVAVGSPRYSGFASLAVYSDGHYRIAAATGVRTVEVASYSAPNTLITPDHPAGHIPCELTFVIDYRLTRGSYIINVISNSPKAEMIIIPRTTKWQSSWDFVKPH
ncbi:hypothetical protein HNO88_002559 [Novosphingobium chloroacetimidivorans]|uniref:Uncharacterized protein n=2 Tax=Novosphingobium chloroacetimidivorans TaxID=1428314 RepID=A0A7W7KAX8_9SPHN|nr:hypothetical protein [Novosphingobium chloroacetimidivorans]